MIAMSLMSTYEEYRRDTLAAAPDYAGPRHPVRHALLHVLSLVGLGVGGMAADDEVETLGIG